MDSEGPWETQSHSHAQAGSRTESQSYFGCLIHCVKPSKVTDRALNQGGQILNRLEQNHTHTHTPSTSHGDTTDLIKSHGILISLLLIVKTVTDKVAATHNSNLDKWAELACINGTRLGKGSVNFGLHCVNSDTFHEEDTLPGVAQDFMVSMTKMGLPQIITAFAHWE